MSINRRVACATLTGAALAGFARPSLAQAPDAFYRGKNLDIVIGYPPGGSNDIYARAIGRHLGKHVPGNPTIVPRNMPGAGSFLAANYGYAVAPKDGTMIGIGAPTLALDEKLGTQGVRYKAAEFNWIGRVDSLVNVIFMWKGSPVRSIADAMTTAATLAGTGVGSTVSIFPNAINNVLGTKFKLIMGYKGSNDAMLAVERGETEGHCTGWTTVKVAHGDWIRDNKISVLVQFALRRHADLPDVPTAVDLARTDEERRILTAITAASEIGTAFFTAPGVPAERVAVLRRAFDATMADPEFLAEAKQMQLSVAPLSGEEVQKLVAGIADLSPDLLEKVRAAYTHGTQ